MIVSKHASQIVKKQKENMKESQYTVIKKRENDDKKLL